RGALPMATRGFRLLTDWLPIESRPAAVVVALLLVVSFTSALPASQSGRGNAAANVPTLPYTLVEWPAPPTSAAGAPGAWNFIQVASVAIAPQGNILVLHRGAHPLMEFTPAG